MWVLRGGADIGGALGALRSSDTNKVKLLGYELSGQMTHFMTKEAVWYTQAGKLLGKEKGHAPDTHTPWTIQNLCPCDPPSMTF